MTGMSFMELAQVIGRWFGTKIESDAAELEIELDHQGRILRVLPNPRDESLILIEVCLSPREGESLLAEAETSALLHRINGDAMAIQDWRFCLDADGSALVRASFYGGDFASELFAEQVFSEANQFVDMLLATAQICLRSRKGEAGSTGTFQRPADIALGFARA
jgi:hypothetical protein